MRQSSNIIIACAPFQVCDLWRGYLMRERVWQKCVERFALTCPSYIRHVGWWGLLPTSVDFKLIQVILKLGY